MSVRVGFDHETIAHRGLTAKETLKFAAGHGFDGVQFLTAESIDAGHDHGKLAGFRQEADGRGLYLEVGIPSPNPARHSRLGGREVSISELIVHIGQSLEAVAALGCSHARAFVGDRHDRFRNDINWATQRQATLAVLELLKPRLEALGIKLAIETHADLTVVELITFLEHLGPEVVGVTFDTANVLMRFDEPVAAAERLAKWVISTHVKDAVLAFTPRGLCWQARPVGSGIVPLPDVLAPLIHANPDLNLSIELHPRTYDLPIYDRNWLGYFPDLTPAELASIVRIAMTCESRYVEGSLTRPEKVEKTPWEERDLDWLASSLGYLRMVVQGLLRVEG